MKTARFPRTRSERLLTREIDGEMVIYDTQDERVLSLNPTAAFVFRRCDGTQSLDDISSAMAAEMDLEAASELTLHAVDELDRCRLIENANPEQAAERISRRQALSVAGALAMIPIVLCIPAPAAAQAGSCLGAGAVCEGAAQPCCPGLQCKRPPPPPPPPGPPPPKVCR